MVFDLAESLTVAARHVVAPLLARQLTFSFDIEEPDLWVEGDVHATARGLHRLLTGALDLLTSGMLVISASVHDMRPVVHIGGVGETADDDAVTRLLVCLSLQERAASAATRVGIGTCPIMGADVSLVVDRDEGFILDAHLPYPIVGGSPRPPSAQGAPLWLMSVRGAGVEIVRRRFRRLGWNVVVFEGDQAADAGAALLNHEAPALVVALEPQATVSAAVRGWLSLPFPSTTRRVLGVPLGSHCLSKAPDPAWVVHPVPFSPRDLSLLTATHEPGFDVDTLSSPLDEPTALPRLLIVDDNPTNRVLASAVANVLGYDAELAEDGSQGVQACLERAPAVVLMDVNMPVMDGIEATRRIRVAQRRGEIVPFAIIGATADTTPEIVQACKQAGMDVVLHKPLDVQDLAAHLRRLCLTAPRDRAQTLL